MHAEGGTRAKHKNPGNVLSDFRKRTKSKVPSGIRMDLRKKTPRGAAAKRSLLPYFKKGMLLATHELRRNHVQKLGRSQVQIGQVIYQESSSSFARSLMSSESAATTPQDLSFDPMGRYSSFHQAMSIDPNQVWQNENTPFLPWMIARSASVRAQLEELARHPEYKPKEKATCVALDVSRSPGIHACMHA